MAKTITKLPFILHASDKGTLIDNAISPKTDVMEIEVKLDSLAVSILSNRWNNLPTICDDEDIDKAKENYHKDALPFA